MPDFDIDEIHSIREKNYEKIKYMSPQEIVDYTHNQAKDLIEEYKCLRKKFLLTNKDEKIA